MGLPHQILPTLAVFDMVTAIVASIHLGLVPTPKFLTVQGYSTLSSLFHRLRGGAPIFASHTILIEQANPKSLLVLMLAICMCRCIVILIIWASIREGIQRGRTGANSEDYSSRAISYSLVCITSVLLNLSNLNILFQTRGAPPNASIAAILGHMSASSLAAEQLIISGVEWLFFVLVVGTNGLYAGPSSSAVEPTLQDTPLDANTAVPEEAESQAEAAEQVKMKDTEAEVTDTGKKEIDQKKDYGSLSDSKSPAAPLQEANAETSTAPSYNEQTITSSTDTSNDDSEEPSAVSSDIIDIPKDRKTSIMGAKERLSRARENGKVRRRSLWKKIRGKADDGQAGSNNS